MSVIKKVDGTKNTVRGARLKEGTFTLGSLISLTHCPNCSASVEINPGDTYTECLYCNSEINLVVKISELFNEESF